MLAFKYGTGELVAASPVALASAKKIIVCSPSRGEIAKCYLREATRPFEHKYWEVAPVLADRMSRAHIKLLQCSIASCFTSLYSLSLSVMELPEASLPSKDQLKLPLEVKPVPSPTYVPLKGSFKTFRRKGLVFRPDREAWYCTRHLPALQILTECNMAGCKTRVTNEDRLAAGLIQDVASAPELKPLKKTNGVAKKKPPVAKPPVAKPPEALQENLTRGEVILVKEAPVCSLEDCTNKPSSRSKYCSKTCSNKNARRALAARKKKEKLLNQSGDN